MDSASPFDRITIAIKTLCRLCPRYIEADQEAIVLTVDGYNYVREIAHVDCFDRDCFIDEAKPWHTQQQSWLEALGLDTIETLHEAGSRLGATTMEVRTYRKRTFLSLKDFHYYKR